MTGNPEAFVYLILSKDICPGHGETLNVFIQAVPELINFTNKVNDLLSFYKESVISSERNGYVYHRAQASQVTIPDCLNGLVDEIHENIRRVEDIVADNPKLREVVHSYMRGYIGFHIIASI
ncbi:terpenoid synthase [Aspergillus ibericus CBS 121593]|uniref:Terpenoid synthase n=1 Tax=Aspergillus ibericus CBS 121593 TaxID=1448316 RepID=A0A395HBP1_9EURO|nr:terpenoid synthase [Aspergillus ibericus CBS 121593]RAL04545.1 terpenoid synthase [Aspergillus ibericus CBS 121593]